MLKDFLFELFGIRLYGLAFERGFWTVLTMVGALILYRLYVARQKGEDPPDKTTRLVMGIGLAGYGALNALKAWFSASYQLFFQDPLVLHTYGVAIAMGFVVAIWMAVQEAKRTGLEPVKVLDLSFYTLVAGLVGSRVAFMMVEWKQYYNMCFQPELEGLAQADCMAPFRFWQGGLVFYGGLILATVVSIGYMKRHDLSVWRYVDTLAPSVAVGQFFGRLGCLAAGCCHGKYCPPGKSVALEWPQGTPAYRVILPTIQDNVEKTQFINSGFITAHPTQLYESGAMLLAVLILLGLRTRKKFHGQILASYIMMYAIIRSTIELFRGDKIRGFLFEYTNPAISEAIGIPVTEPLLLSTSQFISLMMFITGITMWFFLSKRAKNLEVPEVDTSSPEAA